MEFDINAVERIIGEVLETEQLCPDVWYLAADGGRRIADEYYIAAADAQCLSEYAKSLGKTIDSLPGLLFYSLDELDGGRFVVKYEVQRYLKQHGLPPLDDESLLTTAMYGAEHNPEYFGDYPAPLLTPRGMTSRRRSLMPGVFAVETETCETMLAVCHPIWSCDLSDYTLRHGERFSDNELDYMFFPHPANSLSLFELRKFYDEIAASDLINWPALMNAIWRFYPEYAVFHNLREQHGLNDIPNLLFQSLGADFELGREEGSLIVLSDGGNGEYLGF